MYNLTDLQGAMDLGDLAKFSNSATDNLFMIGIVIAVFIVMVMAFKRDDILQSIQVASLLMMFSSVILAYAELIPIVMPIAFVSILALSTLLQMVVKS